MAFTVPLTQWELCYSPPRSRQALRVREHNVLGPYVDGLSRLAVANYKVLQANLHY